MLPKNLDNMASNLEITKKSMATLHFIAFSLVYIINKILTTFIRYAFYVLNYTAVYSFSKERKKLQDTVFTLARLKIADYVYLWRVFQDDHSPLSSPSVHSPGYERTAHVTVVLY